MTPTAAPPIHAIDSVSAPRGGLGSHILYAAARLAQRWTRRSFADDIAHTQTHAAYSAWRRSELQSQLHAHFDVGRLPGLDVLDFGCGAGSLSSLIADLGAHGVVGVDASRDAIEQARHSLSASHQSKSSEIRFVHTDNPRRIPLDDSSVDLICCFDVLEHIADVPIALAEWRRVLRPAGGVWIWWSPWRGPYGHHLRSLLPLPWIHLLFSERAIFDACARIFDSPQYVPRKWDFDRASGTRKPNKWRETTTFVPFLNKLTRKIFEEMLAETGFEVSRREIHGFTGSFLRRAARWAAKIPGIGEPLVSFFIYELKRA